MAAFEAGLSPEIVHVEPGITVLRFIDGRTFGEADMRANVGRLAPLLKDCHTKVGRHLRGPANTFWVFHVIRDYVRLIDADASYLAVADRLERRRCRCRSCSATTTCCRATSWTTASACG